MWRMERDAHRRLARPHRVVDQRAPSRAEVTRVAAEVPDVLVAADRPEAGCALVHGILGPQPRQHVVVVVPDEERRVPRVDRRPSGRSGRSGPAGPRTRSERTVHRGAHRVRTPLYRRPVAAGGDRRADHGRLAPFGPAHRLHLGGAPEPAASSSPGPSARSGLPRAQVDRRDVTDAPEPSAAGAPASPYPASDEHAPLAGIDEFLIHNAPYPVRVMWTPDAQAYERVWFTCQDKVGELLVVIGLAFYPNLGTAEAFAIVNVRGRHTTVRAHKKCPTDRMDMTLGPFHFEVVEPFRQWRLDARPHRARRRLRHHLARYEAPRLPPTRRRHHRRGPRRQPGRRLRRLRPPGGLGRGPRRALRALAPPPTSAPATITGARATASAGPAATWGCSTRTAASGSSSRTSASGATTCSTTSATPASAAGRWPDACTACASSPTPTCCRAARSTSCSPTARSRRCPSSGSATRSPSSAAACTAARTAARPTATSGTACRSRRATRSSCTARPST